MPTSPVCPFTFALQAWPAIWLADLLRYLVPALFVALLIAGLPAAWRSRRRVRAREPFPGQRGREFAYSMLTVVIFSAHGALIAAGAKGGVLRLYFDFAKYGWPYAIASLAALVVAHDAWFYWTHRLLHQRWLFRWAHQTHHRSVAPTPWAAYSFAPAEALVQAVFLSSVLLMLPLHPAVIFVFLTHMIVRNVLGHAGVELMPRAWLAGWWGRWLTTTLHHDMHHACGRCNYGLYFTWWDRICGTEHPAYRERLRESIERMSGARPALTQVSAQG